MYLANLLNEVPRWGLDINPREHFGDMAKIAPFGRPDDP
jgi:hypothetical protein